MILTSTSATPPPALTWTHLLPASATFNCPDRPEWFGQRPACPPVNGTPHVEVLWNDGVAVLKRALDCDGIAAFNCRKFPVKRLRQNGFNYFRHLAVLPNLKKARWFVPLDSPAISAAAMSMYTPSRFSARFKHAALRLVMQTRLPVWYSDHVWIAQRQMPPLEAALNPLFPGQIVRWALSSGAPEGARNRKASAVMLAPDGTRLAFVKMAQSGIARRLMNHETSVLKHLAGLANIADLAPRVLFSGEVDGMCVLAQAPLEGVPAPVAMTSAHREFLAALQTPLIVRAADTATVGGLMDRLRALPAARPDLLHCCQSILPALREFRVPLTIVHGDFAPWNLRLSNGRLSAFDWEYGEPHGMPLIDEMHYRLQTGWLLEKWSARQALSWIQQLSWERPVGLDPREVQTIAVVYLLDALARLLSEGYQDREEIISWHRQILDRLSPLSSPGREAAVA